MRQDKFRVVDKRAGGSFKLCKIISLPSIAITPRITEVEISDQLNRHYIGDTLLIEYDEFSREKYTMGRVVKSLNPEIRNDRLDALAMIDPIRGTIEQEEILKRARSPFRESPHMWKLFNTTKPTEERDMQNHLVELLAKNFYTIGINFEHSSKSYTYKVPFEIKLEVDDKVIVDSTSGLTIVNVVRVDEDASGIDLSLDVKYKFIVQKLDTTLYDELNEKDKKISNVIAQGAREKAKQELLEQYTGTLNEEQVKALEECGVKSLKRLE